MHVDEGALHAYLDGALDEYPTAEAERIRAHLDECAQCAARLEAERAIRSDAHAMLGLAAPEVDMPSLEELRAYVKRTRPTRPPAAVRMYRLGWAASIVLAVGAGWMLRGGQLQEAQLLDRGEFPVEAPALPAAGARESTPVETDLLEESLDNAATRDASTESRLQRGASPARQVETGPAISADAADVIDVAEPLQEAFADRADLPTDVVVKAAERSVSAPAEAPSVEAAPTQVAPEAQEVSAAALDEAERLRAVEDHVAVAAAPEPEATTEVTGGLSALMREADSTAGAGAVASSEAGVAADPDEDAGSSNERRRAESPVPMTLGLDRSGLTPQTFGEGDRKIEAEPLSSVPGYEVLSVSNLDDGTTFLGGRTVQRYDDTRTFEILALEPEVDPSALPQAAEGLNEVRAQAETGWIVLRGPLPEARLYELLAMLFSSPI